MGALALARKAATTVRIRFVQPSTHGARLLRTTILISLACAADFGCAWPPFWRPRALLTNILGYLVLAGLARDIPGQNEQFSIVREESAAAKSQAARSGHEGKVHSCKNESKHHTSELYYSVFKGSQAAYGS